MLFPTFIERKQNFSGGGGSVSTKCVVLAAEPVGGRSRATELPCQNYKIFGGGGGGGGGGFSRDQLLDSV